MCQKEEREGMIPIRLKPAYQHYIWGGDRILNFRKSLPPGRYAESWEVSDREEGMSIVENGEWQGKSFKEILTLYQEKLVGKGRCWSPFPLLMKIIDAKENLSVQVHPNEEVALRVQHQPKSEMWIALSSSRVYAGLKPFVTKEHVTKALHEGGFESLLQSVDLKEGDAIFVPAGQIHAICAGAFLLEIQQNSNTTYRLHDWGRGRELHLDHGMQAIDWNLQKPFLTLPKVIQSDDHHQLQLVIENRYFVVERLDVFDSWLLQHDKVCQILFCVSGEAVIGHERLRPGDTLFIPADSLTVSIQGKCQIIVTHLF